MKRKILFIYFFIFTIISIYFISCQSADQAYEKKSKDSLPDAQALENITYISSNNIPDENFRNYLTNTMGLVTLEECARQTVLSVTNQGIVDITGIKYFTSVKIINFSSNNIENIPVEFNRSYLPSVEQIDFSNNPLTSDAIQTIQDNFNDLVVQESVYLIFIKKTDS